MIRLLLSVLFFLFSLLIVFKTPTNLTWRISVAVTEFPYLFVISALVLLISAYSVDKYKLPIVLLGVFSLVLFLLPIIRASMISSELQKNFSNIFPQNIKNGQLEQPFNIKKCLPA